jgi:hypothetical protein
VFGSSTIHPNVKMWRIVLFAVVAALLFLLCVLEFGGLPSLPEPWTILPGSSDSTYHAEIHRWHDGQWGALITFVFGGSLLALVWQGHKRPLVAQFFAFSALFLTATFVLFDVLNPNNWTHTSLSNEIYGNYSPLIVLAIFLVAYPAPRALLRFTGEQSPSYLLLGLTAVTALFLAPNAVRELGWQVTLPTDEHVFHNHWLSSVQLSFLLVVAGALAATKRPGWQALSIITGITFLYLGSAALAVPTQPGSWGTLGGVIGVLDGITYLAATLFEARRTRKESPLPVSRSAEASQKAQVPV